MARGKKYNDDIKEKVYALAETNNSMAFIAKELNLPRSTVITWIKNREKELEESGGDNFEQLRQKNKENFVKAAWKTIELSQNLIERRLQRAKDHEDELDRIVEEIASMGDKELSAEEKQKLCKKIREIKLEDVGKLVTVLGTLYDKQALASKEATAIVGGSMDIKSFEDF